MKKSKFNKVFESFKKSLNDSEIDEQEGACGCDAGMTGGEADGSIGSSSIDISNSKSDDHKAGVDTSILKPFYEFPPYYALSSRISKSNRKAMNMYTRKGISKK